MKLAFWARLFIAACTACSPNGTSASPSAPLGVDAREIVDVQLDDLRWVYGLPLESRSPGFIRFELARQDARASEREEFIVIPAERIRMLKVERLGSAVEPVVPPAADVALAELKAMGQRPTGD